MFSAATWGGSAALVSLALLAACGSAQSTEARSPATGSAGKAQQTRLTVVELFQSQGCSSCPPANANVNAIAGRADILALSFAVTYWDQLGWKDTFAKSAFTQRQRAYANSGQSDGVYTPQVIVNGGNAIVGADRGKFAATIAKAGPARGGPALSLEGTSLVVGKAQGETKPATVWLVRYDPRSREVPIRAGENGGKTLPHRNIVRELTRLGEWSGGEARFAIPAAREPGLSTATLIQSGAGGPIIAARRI